MSDVAAHQSGPHRWEHFLALDEDDQRELIDGELVEVEVPGLVHEQIVASLCMHIGVWAKEHDSGCVVASGYKVRVSDRRGVMPDLQFFRRENRPSREHENGLASGRPDLAVEIISPSSRRYDRVVKARYYADIGVPEYWTSTPTHTR